MSEWETFCDLCYYDLWRVRRKNERGFNDGYHIHNGEEARALVELLNGLERDIAGWETKWKCAVEMAAVAENQLELANQLEEENADAYLHRWAKSNERAIKAERERDEALAYADKLAAGLPEGMLPKDVEVLRDANLALAVERDALQEQLDAAITLGRMQGRRHERELEQVREQYRLSSVCRKLKAENEQLKQQQL